MEIEKVREVLDYAKPTKVPKAPDFMLGIINLRGGAVPVIDMRLMLGMDKTETTVNTCIIIVEVEAGKEHIVLGAIADSVQEVFDLEAGQIEPAPHIGKNIRLDFLKGMGKHGERFVLLMDMDKVFSADELGMIASSAGQGAALR